MLDALEDLFETRSKKSLSDKEFLSLVTRQIHKKTNNNLNVINSLNLPDFEERLEKLVRESVEVMNKVAGFLGFNDQFFDDEYTQELIDNAKSTFPKDKKEDE